MTTARKISLVLTNNLRMLAILGLNPQPHKCGKTDTKVHDALLSFLINQEVLPISPCFFNLSNPFGCWASPTPLTPHWTAILRYCWHSRRTFLFSLDSHHVVK